MTERADCMKKFHNAHRVPSKKQLVWCLVQLTFLFIVKVFVSVYLKISNPPCLWDHLHFLQKWDSQVLRFSISGIVHSCTFNLFGISLCIFPSQSLLINGDSLFITQNLIQLQHRRLWYDYKKWSMYLNTTTITLQTKFWA